MSLTIKDDFYVGDILLNIFNKRKRVTNNN